MERTRIAIVGGGLVGPTLALALKSVGLDAIVIDATADADRRADDFDGRAYAIALGSQRLLSAIGVWDQIAGNAQEIATIHVGEGSG
ncbi:MAG: FAD-dependent monooxygenase, partial [Pseudomonadota bacterium]